MSHHLTSLLQQSIRENYDLRLKSAAPIGTGAMSTTLKLVTNRGVLFLKIYKSATDQKTKAELDPQRIAFTHTVQNFLHQSGFPVPRLLPNRKGETSSRTGRRETQQIYALSEFIEGHDYDVGNLDQLRAAGEMLAFFHQQLRGFQPQRQPALQLCSESPAMDGCSDFSEPEEFGQSGSTDTEVFSQLTCRLSHLRSTVENSKSAPVSQSQIGQWADEVEELRVNCQSGNVDDSCSSEWIIHGDYRAQNLKFDGGRVHAVLDLDTVCSANRLYDLGYALVFFPSVYQNIPLTADQQSIFLHAYESIYPLSEANRRMLVTHIRVAFLRGMTLWLDLYYFGGMSKRTRPWIQGYLHHIDRIFAFFQSLGCLDTHN